MKRFLGLLLLLISTSSFCADLCDDGSPLPVELQQLIELPVAPTVHARFELGPNCDYEVLTTTYTSSKKSLKEFMQQITDPVVNKASAKSNIKAYVVKKNADGTFEQSATASKSIMSATIVNTCKYTLQTDEKITYECHMKDGDGVLKQNKTVITCSNAAGNLKKCTYKTNGLAIGQFMKNACDLACGGAAETVNSIQRLMEYVTYGKVDGSKWDKPGKIFFKGVSGYKSNTSKKKSFSFEQQIQ